MPLAFLGGLGGWEMIAIAIVALLLFGKRLPEVMRSLGRGVVEFKKGLKGIEDEIKKDDSQQSLPRSTPQSALPPTAATPGQQPQQKPTNYQNTTGAS